MKKIKRVLFSNMVTEIENIATKNKVWGSNHEIALTVITCISKHEYLFDKKKYYAKNKLTMINSAFSDYQTLKNWLGELIHLLNHYLDHTTRREIPEHYRWLVEFDPQPRKLRNFFGSDDFQESIHNYVDHTRSQLERIHELFNKLPDVIKPTLRIKLSNGFNTICAINENILEVMIE